MSGDESTDDSEQRSDQEPADSDQASAHSDDAPLDSDQPDEQSQKQPAEDSGQSTEQSEEEPTVSDQPAQQSEEQPPADTDQAEQPSEDQLASASDQPEEQSAGSDQAPAQSEGQPADSDQLGTSESGTDTVAVAGGLASPTAGGGGVQARPGRQPTRSSRAPVRHDFAVRFTFATTQPGLLAKGFYLFEIRADDGSRLAASGWSSVSVTVPPSFNFSLSQITRLTEKSPSFDFHVDLRWLPFSTDSSGAPADPNHSDNAEMIKKDFKIITTLRPKDNDSTYLMIPLPKGTAVTKIDLHSEVGIVSDAVSAPSADENDFTLALFNRGVDRDELVEKGPAQQYTKDGVTKFVYEIKYYGGASIKEATVLP
jgi:hypothetical protein